MLCSREIFETANTETPVEKSLVVKARVPSQHHNIEAAHHLTTARRPCAQRDIMANNDKPSGFSVRRPFLLPHTFLSSVMAWRE